MEKFNSKSFICGFCGNKVASFFGYSAGHSKDYNSSQIYICSHCQEPNYFDNENNLRIPNKAYGAEVAHVEDTDLYTLYNETRSCYKNSNFNASIMISRKMITHIAVNIGAEANKSFQFYVDYLDAQNYIPPNGRAWVDQIRIIGNEANHEIQLKNSEEAKKLIKFIEMLMKFIYEFPNEV